MGGRHEDDLVETQATDPLPNSWRVPVQDVTSLFERMPQMSDYNTQMMHARQDDEDRAERMEFAIEARSIELMQHGEACDPIDGFNIAEALGEASTNVKMVMAKVLTERKFDQAGILLDQVSREYWAKMAEEMAREELS
jgi:hypothetical protein